MRLFYLGLVALLGACSNLKPDQIIRQEFYDLDSLIKEQIDIVERSNAILQESVTIDAESEQRRYNPDSTEWINTFRIFRDFDLNRPESTGAYDQIRQQGSITYKARPDEKVNIRKLQIQLSGQKPVKITGSYFEDKDIYITSRTIEMGFEEGRIQSFNVSGFQKMVLKDTTRFEVRGTVIY